MNLKRCQTGYSWRENPGPGLFFDLASDLAALKIHNDTNPKHNYPLLFKSLSSIWETQNLGNETVAHFEWERGRCLAWLGDMLLAHGKSSFANKG